MSKAKYTPGPWRLGEVERLDGRAYQRICDTWGDGMSSNIVARVCVAHSVNHELAADGPANARLIAAAPELLEALELTAHCLKYWHEFNERDGRADDNALKAAAAAIAKATGAEQ